jgi:hypothetical protein
MAFPRGAMMFRGSTSTIMTRMFVTASRLLIGVAAAASFTGCTLDCRDNYTCEYWFGAGGSVDTGNRCPQDPKDGEVFEECGVWGVGISNSGK